MHKKDLNKTSAFCKLARGVLRQWDVIGLVLGSARLGDELGVGPDCSLNN